MRDRYPYQLLGCLGSCSHLYSGRRCRQGDGQKAVDHGIDLLRHLKLEEMPRPDGLANDELGTEFVEALQIGVWRPSINIEHGHLTGCSSRGTVPGEHAIPC